MLKLIPNLFIKHKQYRDTCFYIIKVFDTGSKFKIKTERWNLGHSVGFDMGIKENVIIDYSDLINWEWTVYNNVDNLRNCDWNSFI